MGRLLADRALQGGNLVEVIGRDATRTAALADKLGRGAKAGAYGAAPTGDLVILAVPFPDAAAVVAGYGNALSGKTIIDITNSFDLGTFAGLLAPDGSSGAEELAKVAPAGTQVVKAFNTVFGNVLASGRAVDVFFAGGDERARASVSAFIESIGLHPLYVGPISMARRLEETALLMMGLGRHGVGNFDFSLGVVEP
jgi:hypothetical protein